MQHPRRTCADIYFTFQKTKQSYWEHHTLKYIKWCKKSIHLRCSTSRLMKFIERPQNFVEYRSPYFLKIVAFLIYAPPQVVLNASGEMKVKQPMIQVANQIKKMQRFRDTEYDQLIIAGRWQERLLRYCTKTAKTFSLDFSTQEQMFVTDEIRFFHKTHMNAWPTQPTYKALSSLPLNTSR